MRLTCAGMKRDFLPIWPPCWTGLSGSRERTCARDKILPQILEFLPQNEQVRAANGLDCFPLGTPGNSGKRSWIDPGASPSLIKLPGLAMIVYSRQSPAQLVGITARYVIWSSASC